VTTGFWFGVGARDESTDEAGASHFLEHLLFKGSETRGASEIAQAVESVGGEMNAFTAQEHTSFYTRLPAGHSDLGLDLLSEVVWAPALRADDIEAERQVILEEIAMEEDAPDDRVVVLLGEALFPDHSLGREVLGSRASITAMTREAITDFHGRWYRPANLVVAAAGAVDHDEVVRGVADRFAGGPGGDAPVRTKPDRPPEARITHSRAVEQVHLALGFRSLDRHDPDRFALAVLNQLLGGGMSSRLFQSIREERGLAYSVYSYPVSYADCGALVVYAGTAPARAAEVLDLIEHELEGLVVHGPTAAEVAVAVGYLIGSTELALEDSGGCMARIGKALLTYGEVMDVDELLASYRSVTLDDVARVARQVVGTNDRSLAVVGPKKAVAKLSAEGSPGRQRSAS
jgi:predicted Zn-dependent peptidase